ncbi:MAG: hypothetical protein GYA55_01945, partial [SAR324 cluster bacterium]|nr:hypothetical protein [SAR324 cluster bacterium]
LALDKLVRTQLAQKEKKTCGLCSVSVEELMAQGIEHLKAGNYQEALSTLESVSVATPPRDLNLLIAISSEALGDFSKAQQFFQKELLYYPDNTDAQLLLRLPS